MTKSKSKTNTETKKVTLTINGNKISADDGATFLEVIKDNDIDHIPTLCYNELLEPFTSCYLCVVEIDGMDALSPACSTMVQDGMVVYTNSERVLESRKANLELLLSNHYADCHPPCRLACPANVDIQGYIALASRGLYREGQMLMRETNALPMVCGRVCARPCEFNCRRNHVDEPVDIKNIKRFMADLDLKSGETYIPETGTDTGKKIAIVGSGPAGLSAAHFARIAGHSVTIFEKMPEPGGMMQYGIPEYRLPKNDLQKEIDVIRAMGAEIRCNCEMGKDFTIESLQQDNDAVFIAIGAQLGTSMGVPGEELDGVLQGVDFLRDVNLGNKINLSGSVYVIGGGNTAIDASRTALRMGADSVTIIYRRTEAEMPADPHEINDAKDEGVALKILSNPVKYRGQKGRLKSIELIKMELGAPDESGRRRPVEIAGSEYHEDVDFVIEAVGQKVEKRAIDELETEKWGTIKIDDKILTTSMDGVFAGGDAVTGPDIIIGAVAQGRKAAYVMDRYVRGLELKDENILGFHITKEDFNGPGDTEFADAVKIERNAIRKEPSNIRIKSFTEVELGFSEDELKKETSRCMECGCQDLYECRLREYSDLYGAETGSFPEGDYRINRYKSNHQYIDINTAKCINCGQCIRICSEVQKVSVFQFDKRGFDAVPVPALYRPLNETNCISCGLCVSFCPVGAITEKLPLGKPGPFKTSLEISHCTFCGDGCQLAVETFQGEFIKISSKKDDACFDDLCEKGRFGYVKYFNREKKKISGGDINDIHNYLEKLDPESTVISISPGLVTEEIDLILKFAEKRGIDIFSPELDEVADKIALLNDKNISFHSNMMKKIQSYKEIYYFGNFNETSNSVSFRHLIRNDGYQSIHIAHEIPSLFFEYEMHGSDLEMLESLRQRYDENSMIAFNLQSIGYDVLEDLADFIDQHGINDFIILNNYINFKYMVNKIGKSKTIKNILSDNNYETLVAVNNYESIDHAKFKDVVLFQDSDFNGKCRYFVPIENIYEKSGTIIDQLGNNKKIVKSIRSNNFSLSDFFS